MRHKLPNPAALLLAAALCGGGAPSAHAALAVIGTQYRQDHLFPEFNCYYSSGSYPTSCGNPQPGATVFVCVKNIGPSTETITDATLAGYSLQTVIRMSTSAWNPKEQNSIYFYWDDPPQQILDAGEPVWWRVDPPTIPVGGVAQVAVRLRRVPTNHVSFGVVSSSGTITTNITVDATAPRITSIGYSEDRKQIYLHWRRNGGAAPASVWLNGTNVTALTITVGDPGLNFAASVISLPIGLPHFSHHVYQGVYLDGKTATAGQRAWTNKFIYTTWSTFSESGNYTAADWVDEAAEHGFNNVEMNLGVVGGYLGTSAGRAHLASRGYGYTILDTSKLNPPDPDLWFLNDEPDAEENNQGNTHCGTGLRLPCDTSKYAGTLVMKEAVRFAGDLRALRPNVPTTVNLDGGLQPQSFYTWGPAVDVLESNNYYEVRLRDSWFFYPHRLPLHNKPGVSYAVARTGTEAAGPNPFRHILYSCKGVDPDWPYPFPASKRIEAYYSLAGGTKGFGYWWFNPPRGLYNAAQAPALWKELGLIGNEVKTARDLIVRSTPVDLPLTPGSNVWVRAVASGIDTLILYVVNNNFANDITGCKVTNVPNATVSATLPAWMQSGLHAFEITANGLRDVNTLANGGQIQINLGLLTLTRMIVLTTDPQLRATTQQRYDAQVKSNICAFAPEHCTNSPPSITQQPANRDVFAGVTTNFTVVATGSGALNHQWQKSVSGSWTNLGNGGHLSGVATGNLIVTGADASDIGNYRCVVASAYGSVTSSPAALTILSASPCLEVANPGFESAFVLAGGGFIGTNWIEWEANPGVIIGYNETVIVRTGGHAQRLRVWGGVNGSSGGIYQRVPVITGQPFSIGVWMSAEDPLTSCYLGVDSTGGTNPLSGVTWSSPVTNAAWTQRSFAGTAGAAFVTVFLKITSPDDAKRNGYFDDVISPQCAELPPNILQSPSPQNVLPGGNASFTVTAEGTAPLYYQWQKNNANLADGGHYSGCATPTLIITGADASDAASYRCVVTNSFGTNQSAAALLTVITPSSCLTITNSDFESGFSLAGGGFIANGWTEWEATPGVIIGYDETTVVHGGGHSQRLRVSGTGATSGGVFQRVPTIAGQAYTIGVWTYSENDLTTCYLGVDPTGGTNAAGGSVTWTSGSTNVAWVQQTWTGFATGGYLTIFFKVATPDNVRRNGYFDDTSPAAAGGAMQLSVQRVGTTVHLTWPACPDAQLQRAGNLTPPLNWSPATNQVNLNGGLKSVTLAPTDGEGFFRLATE